MNREKVIKGLECCMVGDGHSPKCELCPYATVGDDTCQTMDELFTDAHALLKAPMYTNGYEYMPVINAFWVEETDRENHWRCSNCGKVQGITSIAMKYCPECAARMAEHPWAASGCGQAFNP